MSHHIGARSIASSRHTTEFTNWLRHAIAVQIMKRQVPELSAWRCHGSGTRTRIKAMNAKIGKRGYVGSMLKQLLRYSEGREAMADYG